MKLNSGAWSAQGQEMGTDEVWEEANDQVHGQWAEIKLDYQKQKIVRGGEQKGWFGPLQVRTPEKIPKKVYQICDTTLLRPET